MANFTTWAAELLKFKNAIANRDTDSYFLSVTEDMNEMRTSYTQLKNIQGHLDFLQQRASNEALTDAEGKGSDSVSILLSVGGGN